MSDPTFDMRSASGMQEYCKYYEMGKGCSKKWALKHFELLADDLRPEEEVLTVFMGIFNYISATRHENNAAYAVTTQRIIVAQKNLVGKAIMSVSLDHVNDIKLKTDLVSGIVTFDAMSETFNVFLNKELAQRVFEHARECISYAKNLKDKHQSGQKQGSNVSELRELHGLLQDGIITQEEFEAKKKLILGL